MQDFLNNQPEAVMREEVQTNGSGKTSQVYTKDLEHTNPLPARTMDGPDCQDAVRRWTLAPLDLF